MRVLLLTNLYPTRGVPNGATFIRSRLHALHELGVEVVPVGIQPSWTRAALLLRSVSGREADEAPLDPFLTVTAPLGLRHARRRRLDAPSGRRWVADVAASVVDQVSGPVDVIHAHGMYDLPAGLVASRVATRLGVPYVVSMHGTDVNLLMPQRAALYGRVLAGACATSYVSTALRDHAHTFVPPHPRAHVIHNGVDLSAFRPGPRATAPTVLYVGNLERVKGVDRLPSVWREVRTAVPDAQLVVVGAGSLGPALRRELGGASVRFMGRLDQASVARLMARAHVLVLLSRAEGGPTVMMEAYAAGTPVVGTAVGGIPETVLDPECVVPDGPDLEHRLAGAVVRVLRSGDRSRDLLVEAARPFGWSRVAARELELYRSCGEARGTPAGGESSPSPGVSG
ncbi:glycosyltransferase [Ornithinimicrobium cerasi]|uniref:glycosyltransferase n=1 Tax=Ornithinimicrobium cerasi TaxID=2248773 RepID=UPI00137B1B14|nr:glycosyltransferase [Ornithinimicrobium cerasi]